MRGIIGFIAIHSIILFVSMLFNYCYSMLSSTTPFSAIFMLLSEFVTYLLQSSKNSPLWTFWTFLCFFRFILQNLIVVLLHCDDVTTVRYSICWEFRWKIWKFSGSQSWRTMGQFCFTLLLIWMGFVFESLQVFFAMFFSCGFRVFTSKL